MGGDDFQKRDSGAGSLGEKIKLAKSKLQSSIDNAIEQIMSGEGLTYDIVEMIEGGSTKGWWPIPGLIEGEDYQGIAHDTLCSGLIQHLGHEGVKAEISYREGCSCCWEVDVESNCGCGDGIVYQSLTILNIEIR